MSISPKNNNKVIVITGANRGIGLELCKQLLLLSSSNDEKLTVYALCRKSSDGLAKLANKDETTTTTTTTTTTNNNNELKIIENIDVMSDNVGNILQGVFGTDNPNSIVPIHLLIHNAGAYGPPLRPDDGSIYETQTLSTITSERMLYSYKLNAVAPLLITQALIPNLKLAAVLVSSSNEDGCSKVIIISSGMGSITNNTTGGHYGYRASKAAVNQIGKSLATDLLPYNIAVGLLHPGIVDTEFGGTNASRHPESYDVDVSVQGVIQAINIITLATTGCFLNGNYGQGVKLLQW